MRVSVISYAGHFARFVPHSSLTLALVHPFSQLTTNGTAQSQG